MDANLLWNWIVLLLTFAPIGIPLATILRKIGYSGWWALLFFVPMVNLIALWVLAVHLPHTGRFPGDSRR